jgi:hypothetical protein
VTRKREAGSERRVEQNRALMDENRINEARPRTSGQRIAVHCHHRGGKSGRRHEGTIFLRQIFAVSGRSD